MKLIHLLPCLILLCIAFSANAQQKQKVLKPDLTKIKDSKIWTVANREVTYTDEVYLNGKSGDGLLWLNGSSFGNGTIELDIKGKDERGKSFVGLAFHGISDNTYDAIYFRPFNFKSPERKTHSVQYISHPDYTWNKLREEHPEKYENTVTPVPDPTGWFHVTIIVEHPTVKVFVNNSDKPSLVVDQLSSRKKGWIGFWVGNESEGYFKNLEITPK